MPSAIAPPPIPPKAGIEIAIDRGGTFTDCIATNIPGRDDIVVKLLSVDPSNYEDAPTRSADSCALVVSKGHEDLLRICDQTRPKLLDLNIRRAAPLFSEVLEIDERVTPEEYTEDPSPKSVSELDALVDDVQVVKGVGGELIRILTALSELYDKGVRSLAVILLHSYTFPDHELEIGKIAKEIGFVQVSLSSQLLPMIKAKYIDGFRSGFVGKLEDSARGAKGEFMQSDGGLVWWQRFNGLRAILSGPAGGVVGFGRTCYDEDDQVPCIGFDMGAGVTIQSPQLDITTVAAGGGSILTYRNGLFNAGPQSAVRSAPGPACYRKGGPLTVTDANLVLGRLSAEHFPKIFGPNENEPLDFAASRKAFEELAETINADLEKAGGKLLSVEEVCLGFLNVANESMCGPIRQITESKGYNTGDHNLASFGGAGGQHACAIADRLNIKRVLVHKHASILSAYGMALADPVQEAHEPCSCEYYSSVDEVQMRLASLQDHVARELRNEGFSSEQISYECYINLRYSGSDTMIMILQPEDGDYTAAFVKEHQREFSFTLPNRKVLVENLRVRGRANASIQTAKKRTISCEMNSLTKSLVTRDDKKSLCVYFEGGWTNAPMFLLKDSTPGDLISGPAMIYDDTQMIVVQPGATAQILQSHIEPVAEDPIQLSIMSNRFMGIAEQMGLTLQKTSVSVHIKERLDFSCALFGPDGGMEHAVRYQHNLHSKNLRPGDVLVSNTPLAVLTRLYEEGAQITSMFLVRDGVFHEDAIVKVLIDETGSHPGCSGTRSLSHNLNDLKAQIAANTKGATLVQSLIEECGIKMVYFYMNAIKKNASTAVKAFLKKTYAEFNGQPLQAIDHMDDGTGLEGLHCFNAPSAISKSATMYVIRCLINKDIPLNEGCLLPITFNIPTGTILNPSGAAAVCAGNPITSQRVTDVLIKAFQACAASQGDCNVFSFGFGGKDLETGKDVNGFGFGETICGGSGAGPGWHGTSGVHIHMTNTRITDPELLEKRYPVILNRFVMRPGSEGIGQFNGGTGIIREYEFRRPLSASIVSERRVYQPFGMAGGGPGMSGKNSLVEKIPGGGERWVNIGGRKDFKVQTGDRVVIETPGGGGWGEARTGSEKVSVLRTEPEPQERSFVTSFRMRQEQSN
ncbi:Hydantoinase B/oxoprolinase-domain-containing protein [Rhexocercosporidium sp. MPI-PUGE-AT-0058]|nr:Hydantoinase B/oxoprolinase-domain-containing protein [Rhexocercosporidium sp. MPI-PUGE-AT-0058]